MRWLNQSVRLTGYVSQNDFFLHFKAWRFNTWTGIKADIKHQMTQFTLCFYKTLNFESCVRQLYPPFKTIHLKSCGYKILKSDWSEWVFTAAFILLCYCFRKEQELVCVPLKLIKRDARYFFVFVLALIFNSGELKNHFIKHHLFFPKI